MQRVGVASIARKRLLAAKLRVEMAPGAEMAMAGFAERRRGAGGRTFGVGVCSAGYLAFATAHRLIFKGA
jgi:hypothetical protein